MIGLMLVAVFGVNIALLSETTTFKDRVECEAFAKTMAPRTADYARGKFNLDWSDEVHIEHQCFAKGQPA